MKSKRPSKSTGFGYQSILLLICSEMENVNALEIANRSQWTAQPSESAQHAERAPWPPCTSSAEGPTTTKAARTSRIYTNYWSDK